MKTTEEKNRMIAEFMGHVRSGFNGELVFNTETREEFEVEQLKYHTSWDWLMPVVEKIESIGYNVNIRRLKTSIHPILEDKELFGFVCGDVSKKLDITYDTIVQFIEWYNENK